jgi:hypothetical protein
MDDIRLHHFQDARIRCKPMKLIFFFLFTFFLTGACLGQSIDTRPSGVIEDPIFYIDLTWKDMPFQQAPDIVYSCNSLQGQPKGYLFLFAQASSGNFTYYLVHGWERGTYENGKSPHFAQNTTAEIAVFENGKCINELADGYAWSTTSKDKSVAEKYGLNQDIANKLREDGLDKAIAAFGSEKEFLEKYKINEKYVDRYMPEWLLNKIRQMQAQNATP